MRTSTTPSRSEHCFVLVDIADKSMLAAHNSLYKRSCQLYTDFIGLVAFDSAHSFDWMRKLTAHICFVLGGQRILVVVS
jgi:hypothetical protein